MSFIPRRPIVRRSALLGSAALMAGLLPSGAWAQCTDNFTTVGVNIPNVGGIAPVQELLPLGRGSSLSAFTATINTVNTAFLTGTSAFVSAPGGPRPDQQGGGAWVRGVGGTAETTTTSTGTISGGLVEHRHPELQDDGPSGLRGLSGRARHLRAERRRHRCKHPLRRDRRLPRSSNQGRDPRWCLLQSKCRR